MPEEVLMVLLCVCLLYSLFHASMRHSKCILLQIGHCQCAQCRVMVKSKSFCLYNSAVWVLQVWFL